MQDASSEQRAVERKLPVRKFKLPDYEALTERSVTVSALSSLLVKLAEVDRLLNEARSDLIVLQPTREGRVDLRVGVARGVLAGARSYNFVKWVGRKRAQYAVKLPLANASRSVRRPRDAASKVHYRSAAILVGRMVEVIRFRESITDLIVDAYRVSRTLASAGAVVELSSFTQVTGQLADSILAKSEVDQAV